MNLIHSIFTKRLWLIVFFFLSILIGGSIVYFRGDRPGISIETIHEQTASGLIERTIPFVDDALLEEGVTRSFTIDLNASNNLKSPTLAIVRPLFYLDVFYSKDRLTDPIDSKIGRDVLFIPISKDWDKVSVNLNGLDGQIGFADDILIGEHEELTRYFRIRSMTSIFLLTILLSTAVSMFLLVLFRPMQEMFLSVGAFALSLSLNTASNSDVWFVLSESVEWQLRLKGFAIATSVGFSFYMLSTFTRFPIRFARKAVVVLLMIGSGNLWLPSLENVQQLRHILNLVTMPFIGMTVILLVMNFRKATLELRYYYAISSVLIIGGVCDLLGVYGYHVFPPMMPIASALFMVGMTMFFAVESGSYSERYQSVVKESIDGIVILDVQGRVIDSNPVAEQYSLNDKEVLNQLFAKNAIQVTSLVETQYDFEFELLEQGVTIECHSVPLEQNRALLIFRDVTRQRSEARQALERVRLETVEKVSGGVAHDFNNLFTALQGQIALLQDNGLSDVSDRLNKMEALLNNGSDSIARLQSFIRGEEPPVERLNIESWIASKRPLIQSILGDAVVFNLTCPSHPIVIHVNAKVFEQVWINLLFNARDAMLKTQKVQCWVAVSVIGDVVEIAFEDSGCGIEPSRREVIFQPFVTGNASRQGKGLGLSIVQDAMTQMQGAVRIEDPIHDTGARFVLTIPCTIPSDMDIDIQEQYSILVLEDEELILEMVETFLIRDGYRVFTASTIEQAQSVLNKHRIHCILSDVVLGSRPEDNGIEFCQNAIQNGYQHAVIIMSGYIPERDQSMRKDWYFIPKPFRHTQLITLIDTVLKEDEQQKPLF